MSRGDALREALVEYGYLTDEEAQELERLENSGATVMKPDQAYVEKYRGKVPDMLIRLWLQHGWKDWGPDRLWLCDPALLQPLIDRMFDGDPDYDPQKMVVIAYDAFGTIHIWLGKNKVLRVNWEWNYAMVSHRTSWRNCFNQMVYYSHITMNMIDRNVPFYLHHEPSIKREDMFAPGSEDLFPEALERLGKLNYGEIYGFFPPLSLGGARSADNLRRVPILEYLIFLSRIQNPMLRRSGHPIEGMNGILHFPQRNGRRTRFIKKHKSEFDKDFCFRNIDIRPLGLKNQLRRDLKAFPPPDN